MQRCDFGQIDFILPHFSDEEIGSDRFCDLPQITQQINHRSRFSDYVMYLSIPDSFLIATNLKSVFRTYLFLVAESEKLTGSQRESKQ